MTAGLAHDVADALTSDGGIVAIRPVLAADRPRLTALYTGATPESLRLRFFAQPSSGTLDAEVDRLFRPESDRHLAMLAAEGEHVIGVASCERTDDLTPRAEFSVFVADEHRGRGVGTLLLEHLAARARRRGISELVGEVLPGNFAMLRVARDLSAHAWSRFGDGIVDVGLTTIGDEAAEDAVDVRDRAAERASLRALLSPASVAVVGAGRRPGSVGHETLKKLREYGFTGALYGVSRSGGTGYRSVRDLPHPVDLLVIAVPAEQVAPVIAQGAEAGARAAIVLSAGFGEDGPDGRRRQHELVRLARKHGIRLVGPNCLGVINTDSRVRLDASFAPGVPRSGGLGVAAQSGAVGIALLAGLGISTFVSLGNKADVSGNDLIAYWYDDPATQAVALYLESFGNPRKFARTVRALGRRKPVLALKSGRTGAGRRAGAAAAAAAPAATVDALLAQAGVVRPGGLGDMIDAARMLTGQPLPAGRRLAVVSNAGGLNVLAADAAEAHGLTVPALSPATRRRAGGSDNPVDLGAGASPGEVGAAAAAIADSGEADMLLVIAVATEANAPGDLLDALAAVLDARPSLAAAAVLVDSDGVTAQLGGRKVPVYDLPERAVRALAHAAEYAEWRRRPLGRRPELPDVSPGRARLAVDRALADGGGWQPYQRTRTILDAYGINILPAAHVRTAEAAVAAAERAGYPVVLKSADPELVHKSDTGGVRLGLTDAAAVREAFAAIGVDVLVQRQIDGRTELVAGIAHDARFGSVVLLGAGGVHTDLLSDRALRLLPMTDLDAGWMWRELRCAPLLTGYRGAPAADTGALEDMLLRLGRLADDFPEVAELDLNPVLAGPGGVVAVDAKLRLAPVGAEPDALLRRLSTAEPW
ncbi:bifunctional acetate--CoA ligase family protein/GNAT family N-acetyltransferase [Paractinoplanes atraurantiacus]|uniref:Acyl-CoA synthetase (NDP forming) n=1 Tax=Paractinoplanes atraurantiacus TaxID=1036182 RepID=A0A285JFT8_9ACTN|nr:bifunctional GNAT family N-acetyltransferase/acetate--CoA ligase family protein [Actinoplanes atraurantiacus]SNY59115.1 Acyl-CoA synthetase (NDP forming) [Actinoplanes atraurantiacus]